MPSQALLQCLLFVPYTSLLAVDLTAFAAAVLDATSVVVALTSQSSPWVVNLMATVKVLMQDQAAAVVTEVFAACLVSVVWLYLSTISS